MEVDDGSNSNQTAAESVTTSNKISILPGGTESAATYCILEEDHTLGNLLRWMIMKNKSVEFCGYSAPHPSEDKIHLRIQMYDGLPAKDALLTAISNLEDMTQAISEAYEASLGEGDYERLEDPKIDFESCNERAWAARTARNPEDTRERYEEEKARKEEEERKQRESALSAGKKVKKEKGGGGATIKPGR